MRFLLCLLLACGLLSACAQTNDPPAREHAPEAGAQGYLVTTIYSVADGGDLLETQKRLPWQSDMESYALSFVLDDPAVHYGVRAADGLATVDIRDLPRFPDERAEAAALAAIVNTMLAFHGIERVALTFDGAAVEALPFGTRADGIFDAPLPMDGAV